MKRFISILIFVLASFPLLSNAQKLIASNNSSIISTASPESFTVTDWIFHGDGTSTNSVGTNSGGGYSIGAIAFYDSALLSPHAGRQIEEVQMFIVDKTILTATYTVDIYTAQNSAPEYTETFNSADLVNGWNTIVLSTPYPILGTIGLYVGYNCSTTTFGHINGTDSGPGVAGGNFYSFNGGAWAALSGIVDRNFSIKAGIGGSTLSNDVGMLSIDMDEILVNGDVNIEGTFINLGSNNLTSVDVNWQIDGGTIFTQSLSGLNLATAETHSFVHSDVWTTSYGLHSLNVWVSNFNAAGDDQNTDNDSTVKNINVANNSTTKVPLFEEFTSSTCGPCAWFNGTHFNAFIAANHANLSLVKYQMNWPGSGDPYYTAEGGVRRNYYGVSGVPTTYIDGDDPNFFGNPTTLQPKFDEAAAKPAYFGMLAGHEIDGNNITVEVITDPYIEGTFTLQVAVVEKTTTGNTGGNGETSFEYVMMKMLPNASGTVLNCTLGNPITTNFTFDMSSTNVEEMTDLAVIAFVQNNSNKEVMQSITSTENSIGVDEVNFKSASIYPNPVNNILNINNAKGLTISLTDVLGRVVLSKNNISSAEQLNVSEFKSGTYFLKLSDGFKTRTKKIIISK
jgi:hypothetical protein